MLRRLAGPLSILALASGTFAYWLAWQYTAHVVDRSLVDLANAVAQQIRISGDDATRTVPPLAEAMFSDPVDQLVYRIRRDGTELAGNADLPSVGAGIVHIHNATVFDARFLGTDVRIAQVIVAQPDGHSAVVEVGQRIERRLRLAAEFLIAIMTPLLLLLFAGWLIVWRVVNQQLLPLTVLADTLNRQTHMSLEPVDETDVPVEIRPLTSALNALLERLGQALDAQRKFIADAAHQLRTPLTAVKLHADQAGTAKDPERIKQAIVEVRASADRAVRLSNQLLSLARADPNEQIARFVDIDAGALAFETGAEWVPRALDKGIDLGIQLPGEPEPSLAELDHALDDDAIAGRADGIGSEPPHEPMMIRGNPVLLREIVANLIDNALKYVPPHRPRGGRVTVSVVATMKRLPIPTPYPTTTPTLGPRRPCVDLIVEDNGPGVQQAMQGELFERFFRGDAHAGQEGGAGLGLAIVRDIVRLHGGSVRYEDATGGGSRFIVSLPLIHRPPHAIGRT
ncbi:sensor histidine kinase N-terminal domain-containing protein [Robbsia sp. KACC 23696]|uniref:sensor histidine kinase n=1 Tax=Robbsia sp. KACC 23696 TaxID=3149231 RepID=UPI00325B1492